MPDASQVSPRVFNRDRATLADTDQRELIQFQPLDEAFEVANPGLEERSETLLPTDRSLSDRP